MLHYEFFVQFLSQQLNLLCCSCMSRGTHPAMFLATCLATCPSGDEVEVEGVFLLVNRTKHCETSCKRGVTLFNASKIRYMQRCRNPCEMLNLILLRATLAATKILRDLIIAGYVIPCNFSCNLCRNKIARQVARKIA